MNSSKKLNISSISPTSDRDFIEECERLRTDVCYQIGPSLHESRPYSTIVPDTYITTDYEFIVYSVVLAILAFISTILDILAEDQRRKQKMAKACINIWNMLVFRLMAAISVILRIGLLLSMACMNYFLIIAVIIGYFAGDLVASCILMTPRNKVHFSKSTKKSKKRNFAEKSRNDFGSPARLSTFQHYSVIDRSVRLQPSLQITESDLSDTYYQLSPKDKLQAGHNLDVNMRHLAIESSSSNGLYERLDSIQGPPPNSPPSHVSSEENIYENPYADPYADQYTHPHH